MALAYLLSPTFQVENSAGKPATGGWLEVFVSGSRDPYYCYSDFQGTLHPFKIPLDSLGSNVVLADDGGTYDVYVYNRYGSLLMSRYNVKPGQGAGGGGGTITSSDGSIDVTMTPTGYDLKVNGQEASVLRAGANDLTSDGQFVFYELVRDGDHVTVDTNGKIRLQDGWYHYDVTARVKWEDGVTVDNTETHVQLYTTLNSDIIPFDCSYEHEDTLHLHGQVKITTSGSQFVVGVQGIESGMSIELVDCGLFAITGHGDAAEYEAGTGIVIDDHEISIDPSVVQEKLTAGTGIIIDDNDNEISVDTTVIQEKLTAGNNIVIEGNTISATAEPQLQSNWAESDSSSVQYIQNKPENLVQDADYVHTDNNFTDAEKSKLAGIEAGAEENVQSDWTESDTSSDAYILHKPSVKPVSAGDNITITEGNDAFTISATDTTYTAGQNITITNNVISATAEPQLQSDWAETDTASVQYIQNKPNLALKEDVANKAQTIVASSTTDYPSSAATAQFVNSSVATATANFLGNFTLTDLGLTYPATDSQIGAALDSYTWPVGVTPTNNDYTYIEIQNPQTTGIDDSVERFKFNGTNWVYEYTLNNSSFTAAEKAAIDSGINATKVGNYDAHIADTTIHVPAATSADADKVLTVNSIGIPEWAESQGLLIAVYGTTTYNVIDAAARAGKIVYCYVNGRFAFLAYTNTAGADLNYEFQYYRSAASGKDSVFIYKVRPAGSIYGPEWETTQRDVKAGNISYPVTKVNVNGASAMTGTVANITIPAAPTVDQTYDATSTNAQSGTAVAGAISTKQDTISDLATIRSGAALGATAVQPGDLATVASTGSYTDLSNTPHIPVIGTVTL